ncbi:uncharacterized protein LOC131326316 [Rhododendron vialii]|uniref:uncharacterized protein LOC131326316 n=1 Tax=Rhododendron vialii TaxID=182163 RepID=UPI0026604F23|nr:uncharacterized protein LOC131326316 [Rhododendron vialii]XP_058215038.1 uncharacterized protein LOC131326316 [Rhododendron vialii]XP_058215039.1 uncharacterized protein LOC131326316 [Rhododendron vialii]
MDKSWIHIKNRLDPAYVQGVENFIEFAYANKLLEAKIYCPCKKCVNLKFETRTGGKEHIIINGFDTKYTRWTYHEELSASSSGSAMDVNHKSDFMDDMVGLVHDAFGIPRQEGDLSDAEMINGVGLGLDEKTKKFFKLLEDAKRELYPGCKTFTTLSFIMRLMHIKVLNGITDKAFDMLLECLKLGFPPGETLPPSYNEAKKFRESLGFSYVKYDACPNDCMLFWKDKKDLDKCEICQTSRYKESKLRSDDESIQVAQIPAKQVRHFSIKASLQRLFMTSEIATHMRWHADECPANGSSRHPADLLAWKALDERYPMFASDSQNVRLGLAADGFDPYRTMNNAHSTWPVVLMPYNLPPWLCMKQPFFILALLIDGPSMPRNDLDVYLQPLIDELKELWFEGILTYDASTTQMFQ